MLAKHLFKTLSILVTLLITSQLSFAQIKKITGKVVDSEGLNPLEKVTVRVKNGKAVTSTDVKGFYSIDADANSVLQFSYTGFTAIEKSVSGQAIVNVEMQGQKNNLDEVVVVGYGTQKVKDLTTAVSKLDNKALASAPRSNIGQALQGTLPGVQVVNTSGSPGTAPKIILRGGASIDAPGDPLVIVDGVIRQYNDVAPQDVESVQILKDAASTAIYGARASNGVLLITTKKGKSGKAQINYKFTMGYNQNRFGYKYLDAHDYLYYTRLGSKNAGRSKADVDKTLGFGVQDNPAYQSSFDIRYLNDDNKNLLSQGWKQMTDPFDGTSQLLYKDHSGEIQNLLFRNSITQDHYVSASGGNEKGNYYASFDYYNEDGVIVGSSYKRYTGNVNGSYKLRPNLEIQTGVLLSTASTYGIPGANGNTGNPTSAASNALYRTLAIWPTFNPWLDEAKTKPNAGNSIVDGNPLYWLGKQKNSNDANKVTGNASLKWDLTKELYIKGTASAYLQEGLNTSFQYPTTTYSGNTSSLRQSYVSWNRDFQKTFNVIANYSKVFDSKHDFSAMAGAEVFSINSFQINQLGQKASTDDITTTNASTEFPVATFSNNNQTQSGSSVTTVTQPVNGSFTSAFGIFSVFGRVGYTYDNRYLLTGTLRRDQVSVLPQANNVGYFPGVSFGWNVQNEKFFKDLGISKYINMLKPRVSYGSNGNIQNLDRYEVQGVYASQGNYGGAGGYLSTGLVNPSLQWEHSKQLDVAVDLSMLNNRITFTLDYFNKINSQLLTNIDMPSYTGYSTMRTNLGTLRNRGIELSFNALLYNKNDWSISVGANATHVTNRVIQLPNNGNDNNRQGGLQVWDPNTGQLIWVGGKQEGRSLGDVYAFKQLGVFKDQNEVNQFAGTRQDDIAKLSGPNSSTYPNKIGPGDVNWMDVDKNDTINNRDQVYIGNIFPKWTGGFNTTVSYKGLSLYTRWEFAANYIIYNDLVARTLGEYQGSLNFIDLQKQSWSENNTNTDVPRYYWADQVAAPQGRKSYTRINNAVANLNSNNSRFYERGDYLAIREVTLSYQFPADWVKKSKVFNTARVYVTGNNLGYITKFSGQSPEAPIGSTGQLSGVYTGSFPLPRTYIFGVQVSF